MEMIKFRDKDKYSIFEEHLQRLRGVIYHEEESEQHRVFTKTAFQRFVVPQKNNIKKALDVGCGSGVALEFFHELGIEVVGITLSDKDFRICSQKGFKVSMQDMSFLEFGDSFFDLVWARHCLEHSPMPIITLLEFERVTRKGGFLYVEVPQDDSVHVDNPNHFSVLSDRMWQALFRKTGFKLLERIQFTVEFENWVDIYWSYWLQKM